VTGCTQHATELSVKDDVIQGCQLSPLILTHVLYKGSPSRQAITELKLNKSPGVDGLTSEFYKTFFYKTFSEELAPFLLNLFLQCIDNGKLPPTLTQGLIILIPKPKKML